MSFTVHFFTFTKKPNSTAVPTNTHIYHSVLCELKDNTSIITPVLVLHSSSWYDNNGNPEIITSPFQFNYCYIAQFSRYYFIRDWIWTNGLWECHLKCDVLGTYAQTITASTQYVLRSAYSFDGTIHDSYYPTKRVIYADSRTLSQFSRNLTGRMSYGYYLMAVITQGSSMGCTSYYVLDEQAMTLFKNTLFLSSAYTAVTDVSEEFVNITFNPFDYIVSCKWFPCLDMVSSSGLVLTATTDIAFGYWVRTISSGNAYILESSSITEVTHSYYLAPTSIPSHPQSSTRGTYLNGPEYTKITMCIAPYGTIDLPNDIYYLGCYFIETIDFITGDCSLRLFIPDENGQSVYECMGTYEAHMAIDVQLAQVKSTGGGLENIATGLLSNVAHNIVESIGVESPIKNIASGVINSYMNDSFTVKVGNPNGSFAQLLAFGFSGSGTNPIASPIINFTFIYVADDDNTHFGRPLCQSKTLNTLVGYTLCRDADVKTIGTDEENREINDFLNSGFFIE